MTIQSHKSAQRTRNGRGMDNFSSAPLLGGEALSLFRWKRLKQAVSKVQLNYDGNCKNP